MQDERSEIVYGRGHCFELDQPDSGRHRRGTISADEVWRKYEFKEHVMCKYAGIGKPNAMDLQKGQTEREQG